jgi:hypothetical protein
MFVAMNRSNAFCLTAALVALTLANLGTVKAQPTSTLVYTNRVGNFENRFVIGPTNMVAGGRYKLEPGGPTQFDRLTYQKDIEFNDERESPFQKVRGWVYRGSDKTENGWLIVFSKERSAKTGTFPVYYVLRPGEDFRRWLLPSGTRRFDGGLQDEISAVLWANQLDFNRLGLKPFSERQQSPISVTLAWSEIRKEMGDLLSRYGTRLESQALLRGPDGRLHMNVDLAGGRAQEVAEVMGIFNNVPVDFKQSLRTTMIQAKQISPQYLTAGRPDVERIAVLLSELIRGRSAALQSFNFEATQSNQGNGCYATSTPWKLLMCGDQICQFWRIRYDFRVERQGGREQYQLSTEFDIGECRVDERQFGDSRIVWRSSSKDAEGFEYLSSAAGKSQGEVVANVVTLRNAQSRAPGYAVYDPMSSFSLKQLLDLAFNDYVKAIVAP